MSNSPSEYELRYGVRLIDRLGAGKDGSVYKSDASRAVKFLGDVSLYRRELRTHQILQKRGISAINEFQIPELIGHDDELLAIEM